MIINVDDILNSIVKELQNHPAYIETIADSGCTGHYLKDAKVNKNLPNTSPHSKINVQVSNGEIMTSKYKKKLNIPALNQEANEAHIFEELITENLLSIGKLCDVGCKVMLDEHKIHIIKNCVIILKGDRDYSTGMWKIKIPLIETNIEKITSKNQANLVLPHKPISDGIKFMHDA